MSCLELDDDAVLKVAEPMMNDIMAGLSRREYKAHSAHFSVVLKSAIGPEKFLESCDENEGRWGRPTERELIAIFRKEKSFTVIWNQKFDQTDDQVVALVTVALKGGRHFVDHFSLH